MADRTPPVYAHFLSTVSARDRHQIGTTYDLEELNEEKVLDFFGATRRIRTDDLLITKCIPASKGRD
jgi:hypothetical protein